MPGFYQISLVLSQVRISDQYKLTHKQTDVEDIVLYELWSLEQSLLVVHDFASGRRELTPLGCSEGLCAMLSSTLGLGQSYCLKHSWSWGKLWFIFLLVCWRQIIVLLNFGWVCKEQMKCFWICLSLSQFIQFQPFCRLYQPPLVQLMGNWEHCILLVHMATVLWPWINWVF